MEEKLNYPCRRWRLMPSFKPAEVELVEEVAYWGTDLWGKTSTGTTVRLAETFASKVAAIAAGWERVSVQQADIDKRITALDKRRTALKKAEATQ